MVCPSVEVWQGLWASNNYQSLNFWDILPRQGRRVVAVGGSDKHVERFNRVQDKPFAGEPKLHDIGTLTTWVYAGELSAAGILSGIQAGHVFISADLQEVGAIPDRRCRWGWVIREHDGG